MTQTTKTEPQTARLFIGRRDLLKALIRGGVTFLTTADFKKKTIDWRYFYGNQN